MMESGQNPQQGAGTKPAGAPSFATRINLTSNDLCDKNIAATTTQLKANNTLEAVTFNISSNTTFAIRLTHPQQITLVCMLIKIKPALKWIGLDCEVMSDQDWEEINTVLYESKSICAVYVLRKTYDGDKYKEERTNDKTKKIIARNKFLASLDEKSTSKDIVLDSLYLKQDDVREILAKLNKRNDVEGVIVENCTLDNNTTNDLIQFLKNKTSLRRIEIPNLSVDLICEFIKTHPQLEFIHTNSYLSDQDWEKIRPLLYQHKSLCNIGSRYNNRKDREANKIVNRNKFLNSIEQNLAGNEIKLDELYLRQADMEVIAEKLNKRNNVESIIVTNSDIEESDINYLEEFLKSNLSLRKIKLPTLSPTVICELIKTHPQLETIEIDEKILEQDWKKIHRALYESGNPCIVKHTSYNTADRLTEKIVNLNKFLKSMDEKLTGNIIKLDSLYLGQRDMEKIVAKLQERNDIQSITITNCIIGPGAMSCLANFLKDNKTILTVILTNNGLTDKDIPAIKTIFTTNKTMQSFDITGNTFTPTDTDQLVKIIEEAVNVNENFALSSVSITQQPPGHYNNYSNEERLAQQFHELITKKINGLLARNNGLLKWEQDETKTVITWENQPLAGGGRRLCELLMPVKFSVKALRLLNCRLNANDVNCLATFFKDNTVLRSIILDENTISDEGTKFLAEALSTCSGLILLSLKNNSIGNAGMKALSELIKQENTSLAYLYLSTNNILGDGVLYLAQGLENNKRLIGLYLSNTPIPGEALISLADALLKNSMLTTLALDETAIDEVSAKNFIGKLNPQKKKEAKNMALAVLSVSPAGMETKIIRNKPQRIKKEYNNTTKKIITAYQELTCKHKDFLIAAVNSGNLELTKKLISEKTASMYVMTSEDDSLLHLAVKHGHVEIVKYLLSLSFNKMLWNKASLTALDLAQQKQAAAAQDSEEKRKYETIINLLTAITPTQTSTAQTSSATSATIAPSKKRKADEKPKAQNDDDDNDTEELSPVTAATTSSTTSATVVTTLPPAKKPKVKAEVEVDDDHAKASTTDYRNASTSDHRATSSTATISNNSEDSLRVLDLVSSGHLYQLRNLSQTNPGLLSVRDSDGNTLLHIATNANQLQSVEFLLKMKIKLTDKNGKGLTVLYQLILNLHESRSNTTALETAMDIAWLLIRHKAEVNLVIHDTTLERNNLTALHLAAAHGYYRLLKIILAAPECDLNAVDSAGWTALDWAVSRNDERMIRRLLIEPRLSKASIDAAKAKATILSLEKIIPLLEHSSTQRRLADEIGIQWVKSFFVSYGSSHPQRVLTINSDAHHAELLLQNTFSNQRLFNPETDNEGEHKDTDGNPVTASLTFVVSAKPYQRNENSERITIHVPLNFRSEFHIAEEDDDYHENIIHRSASAPPEIFDKYDTHIPKTAEEIRTKHTAGEERDPGFWQDFHHGEQGLLNYLENPQTTRLITQKLITQPNFKAGCKVYAVILNIHSPRYVCSNCEVGILGEQNSEKSLFLTNLAMALRNVNCVLPRYSPLRMLTQVSSYEPYQSSQTKRDEHNDAAIDLRACHNRLILERDVEETTANATQFQSSKPK